MTEKEIKSLYGAALVNRMKAFARKARMEGKSVAEVRKALKTEFGKRLKTVNSALPITRITKIARITRITGNRKR